LFDLLPIAGSKKPILDLLKNFNQTELFEFCGACSNLNIVLSTLCERPENIKQLFIDSEINTLGIFCMKLYNAGDWKTFVVDDYVPIGNRHTHDFTVCPPNPEALEILSNGAQKIFEIWPQLVAKCLAKHLLNYQNLANQDIPGIMKSLTGMPTQVYKKVKRLNPNQIRQCFKNQYIVIARADPKFFLK
jgi:hypothetical protein